MSLHKRLWLLVMALCVLLGVSNEVTAQETSVLTEYPSSLSPTAQISFLAAAPSNDEVYTVYGHAGLRVWDAEQGMDVVFNYGIFDFSEDFLIRYLQGKTDYIVLPMPTMQGAKCERSYSRPTAHSVARCGHSSWRISNPRIGSIATMPFATTAVHAR